MAPESHGEKKGWCCLFYPPNGLNFQFCWFNLIFLIALSWSESNFMLFLFFYSIRVSVRSKRFQSSYCAKVKSGSKKEVEGGGGGDKRKCLPANPTILENAPWYFTVRFICKLTARQNRNITNRLSLDYQICKITLFSNRTRCRWLQEL